MVTHFELSKYTNYYLTYSLLAIICLFTFANITLLKLTLRFCGPLKEEFESFLFIFLYNSDSEKLRNPE